jgi:S-DNA-T family DNA segregation ATPase FtsK/SpoIIIE
MPENLPAVADEILEGEVVDQPRPIPARVAQVVVVVVRHPAVRHTGRHAGYIPAGAYVTAKWLWEVRSGARFDRGMRAAQATGNHEAAMKWEELRQKWVAERRRHRMDRARLALEAFRMAPRIAMASAGVLGTVGVFMAIAEKRAAAVEVPFEVVARVVMWVFIAVSVSYGPFLLAAPEIAILVLWHVGRTAAGTPLAPGWARTAGDADADVTIDETTIARALEGLRIPQVRDYLKQGLPLQFIVTCRQEGRGTYCKLRLPVGVTAEKIARRRGDLATGLYRQAKETWPSTGEEAGILELWVADKGALAEGAGPYPLLSEGFTDVFRGVPFGKTLKGTPLDAPLMERNTIVGGMPGQGKSSAARVILCGAALDVTAELRICIPDTNFDFEALKPRCSVYVMGAETEKIAEIRDELVRLKEEIQVRGELLVQYQEAAVTRQLASAGVGLHPLFFLLEEAHVAITHEQYGKEISGLLVDIVRLGRKRAVHVLVSTQAPTKDSMPRDVTRNCSNGIAYAVGDHVANDALLGQGAYRGGHRATELIPGTDRGIALVKGFSGERSEMVQSYFVDVAEVPAIVDRALKEIARRGLELPGSGMARVIEARDLLTDVAAVVRSERLLMRDLLGLLRDLAPAWAEYRGMTATSLRQALKDRGVRVVNSSGSYWLDPSDVPRDETGYDS